MCKWDKRFLKLAHDVASWSKDDSSKVGAYIIDSDRFPISHGYNGLPPNLDDDVPERHLRPQKYLWYEHAERNAIYTAKDIPEGCTMYVTHYPCADCARAIVRKNIKRLVVDKKNGTSGELFSRMGDSCMVAKEMLEEAGVEIIEQEL